MPRLGIRARHSVRLAVTVVQLDQEPRAFAEMLNSGGALQLAADGVFREGFGGCWAALGAHFQQGQERPPQLPERHGKNAMSLNPPRTSSAKGRLERPSLVGPVMFDMFGNVIQVGTLQGVENGP